MKRKINFLILVVFSCSLLSFIGQVAPKDEFLTFLQKKLALFNKEKQREFVYLMFDKSFYKPGESIWFSAWVTEGNHLRPTAISQKLHVDLINPKGSVVKTLQIPIFSGRSNGDFELDVNDAGGIYKIRAYTQYGKNFGKQNIFEKELTVQKIIVPRLLIKLDFQKKAYGAGDEVKADFSANRLDNKPIASQSIDYSIFLNGIQLSKESLKTDEEGKAVIAFKLPDTLSSNDGLLNIQLHYEGEKESISRSIPILLNHLSINFYPEGGKLVAGNQAQVAFKALNEYGKPADFEGVLVDHNNNEIAKVSSFYQGFGSFNFIPKKNENYKLKVTKPIGVTQEYQLQKAEEEGYSLQIGDKNENSLTIKWNSDSKKEVYLVASVRDVIYYSEKIGGIKGENSKELDTKAWPSGIARINLFNHNKIVVSERLVFVGDRSPMNISIETDKDSYQPGDLVKLKINAKTADNKPVKAKLAISVVDNKLFTFADDRQDNMLSYLLMSNEINERIEEPLYYFNKDKEKAWEALDYVMMCSSLKRLAWLEIINNQPKIRFLAENPGIISGRVVNTKTKQGVESTVWLAQNNTGTIEYGGRTTHAVTTSNGYFTFMNANPSEIVFLFAQSDKVDSKFLKIQTVEDLKENDADFSEYVKDVPEEIVIKKQMAQADKEKTGHKAPDLNLNFIKNEKDDSRDVKKVNVENGGLVMDADNVAVEECVVVGYGVQRKSDITGAVTVINIQDINENNVMKALNGRVAGLEIIEMNPGAVDKTKIRIRGSATVNNNSNPLFVIDGMPVLMDQNQDYEPFSYINPQDVSSIEVLKGSQAQAVYGVRASQGAIIITTKKKSVKEFTTEKKNMASPFASKTVVPSANQFSSRRRFDAYLQSIEETAGRSDFRSTLFWDPLVETDENGLAVITFKNSDEVSSFKIIAEGISVNGQPGRGESVYHTSLPVYVSTKMPAFVCFSDTVKIPLMITNNTNKEISGQIKVSTVSSLKIANEIPKEIIVKAGEKRVINLSYFVENKAGIDSMEIGFIDGVYNDVVKQKFEVIPVGFPVLKSFASKDLDKEYEVELSDVLNGSLQVQLTAYPSVVADIFSGVEGLLREPYGCFEQTSVSSYPNLLVMDYLKTTESQDKKLLSKASDLMKLGYARLTTFETPAKGYEWFGGAPGHEALTAYGLMQFNDMKSACNYVDNKMVDRTIDWLLQARDGKGKFKRNSRALDTYGSASEDITNAYIVYALIEAGYKNLKPEFDNSCAEALASKDPYMHALMANAAISSKDNTKANEFMGLLYKEQNADGSWNGSRHSITYSTGASLITETTALATMAVMKSTNPDINSLNKAIQYLIKSRSGCGTFGSTQATILALKAITQFAKFSKRTAEAGTIEIYIDDKKVAQTHYEKGDNQAIVMDGLEQFVKEGKNKIRVKYVGCNEALPYSLAVNWRSKTPQSSKKSQLKLQYHLQSDHVSVSDVVRLSINMANTSKNGQPMSMIKIGIPGGLSPQPWQLKELRDKGIIDFYEIFNNYLVFYFRQMSPEEVKQINLDLKADLAGDYEGAASCAYLYYTDEDKDWVKGLKIRIEE